MGWYDLVKVESTFLLEANQKLNQLYWRRSCTFLGCSLSMDKKLSFCSLFAQLSQFLSHYQNLNLNHRSKIVLHTLKIYPCGILGIGFHEPIPSTPNVPKFQIPGQQTSFWLALQVLGKPGQQVGYQTSLGWSIDSWLHGISGHTQQPILRSFSSMLSGL